MSHAGRRLDNIALVPASLLPFKAQWEELRHSLDAGDVLMVMPPTPTPLYQALRRLAPKLRAHGRRVTAVPVERFR
ncbi:MAG TPA: hypothetical protein VLA19_24300 [Herpetosiphonaceae bacterium]|nr:hypothetical protein [Herpetosiphonaceae bacterium]